METALVGFKKCGCCVAVDLDNSPKSAADFVKRGYTLRTMEPGAAISMLGASNCMHGIYRGPALDTTREIE